MHVVGPSSGRSAAKKTLRIVLTGGPGAGKSAIANVAKRTLHSQCALVQEAATIVYRGGFPRSSEEDGIRCSQRAIFAVQQQLEYSAELSLKDSSGILLCDRGTLDGAAYWPSGIEGFAAENNIDWNKELARYHAVLHLRVPNADEGYDLSNSVRNETPEEAKSLDRKIASIWSRHPRYLAIAATKDFEHKVSAVLSTLRDLFSSIGDGMEQRQLSSSMLG